jgi:hypothetical protein
LPSAVEVSSIPSEPSLPKDIEQMRNMIVF